MRVSGQLAMLIWSADHLARSKELSGRASSHLEAKVVNALQLGRQELVDCTVEIQQRMNRELARIL